MRILITNNTLDDRAGSELYVRDLAIGLLNRGHTPIAYSTRLGEVARDIRAATIPVIDNLDALAVPPDVIHGHHHLETMTALLRFPGVPAVSLCHGWLPWEETPIRFPRILRYLAVDHTCRDRLLLEHGIPEDRVQVLLNFVDLERFRPRGPLPARPERALIFSNQANEHTHTPLVREACARYGITVDVIGSSAGNVCAQPEKILGGYDIVFAKGRAALESLAVGAAVVLCDARGVGPLVTSSQFDHLRPLNFGLRVLRDPVSVDVLDRQIARYDAEDAAKVSLLVRASAGRDAIVDQIIAMYRDVIAENKGISTPNRDEEARAAAAYLRWLASTLKSVYAIEQRASLAESGLVQMRAECSRAQALLVERDETLQSLSKQSCEVQERFAQQIRELSSTVAEKDAQLGRITKSLGWRLLSYYGPIKYRFVLPPFKIIKKAFGAAQSREQSSTTSNAGGGDQSSHHPYHAGTEQFARHHSSLKDVFTKIYYRQTWGDGESVSGPGSTVTRTAVFRDRIADLLNDINARTMLDAGCGDFNWMGYVKLDLDRYIGADVVSELVSENQRKYAGAAITFLDIDVTKDELPQVDVILSRDCLVHLSFEDILSAIRNFKQSGSTYLLTTTFTSTTKNTDISTGDWRPLNLQLFPFNFPEPLRVIDEKRTHRGVSTGKYLALWALKDLVFEAELVKDFT